MTSAFVFYSLLAGTLLKISNKLLTPDSDSPLIDETPPVISTRGSFVPQVIGIRQVTPVIGFVNGRQSFIETTSSGGKGATGAPGVVNQTTFTENALHYLCAGVGDALTEIRKDGTIIFSERLTPINTPSGSTVVFEHEGNTYIFRIYWGEGDVVDPLIEQTFGISTALPKVVKIVWQGFRLGGYPQWSALKYVVEKKPKFILTSTPTMLSNGLGPVNDGLIPLQFDGVGGYVYLQYNQTDVFDTDKVLISGQPALANNRIYTSDGAPIFFPTAQAIIPTEVINSVDVGQIYDTFNQNSTWTPTNVVQPPIQLSSNIAGIIGATGFISSHVGDGNGPATYIRNVPQFTLTGFDVNFNFHFALPADDDSLEITLICFNGGVTKFLTYRFNKISGTISTEVDNDFDEFLGFATTKFAAFGQDNNGIQWYRIGITFNPTSSILEDAQVSLQVRWDLGANETTLHLYQTNDLDPDDSRNQSLLCHDPGNIITGITRVQLDGLDTNLVPFAGKVDSLKRGFGYRGANVAHAIAQILMSPFPDGLGLPQLLFNLDSLELLSQELGEDGEGLRLNMLNQAGVNYREILVKLLKDFGIVMYWEEDIEKYTFLKVRNDVSVIHFEDKDFLAPVPNIKKSYENNRAAKLIFSYPERSNNFRLAPVVKFNDFATVNNEIPTETTVDLTTVTDRESAELLASRLSLLEFGEPIFVTFNFKSTAKVLRPGMKFTTSQVAGEFTVVRISEKDSSNRIQVKALTGTYDNLELGDIQFSGLLNSQLPPPDKDPALILMPLEYPSGTVGLLCARLKASSKVSGVNIYGSLDGDSYGFIGGLSGYGVGGTVITDFGDKIRFKAQGHFENMFPDILSDFEHQNGNISVVIGSEIMKAKSLIPTATEGQYELTDLIRGNKSYTTGEEVIAVPKLSSFMLYSNLIKPGFSGYIKVVPYGLTLADVSAHQFAVSEYFLEPMKIPVKEELPEASVYPNSFVIVDGKPYYSKNGGWYATDNDSVPFP